MDIFKKYPDFVLIGLAVTLMVILAASFIWVVQVLITNFDKAIGFNLSKIPAKSGFDLEGAKALDLKGLIE